MELEWPGSLALLVVAGALLFVYIFQQTRMDAAKQAAITFVERQRANRNIRVGVVSFSDNATIVALPSTDRDGVIAAIERLKPLRSTAIGRAIIVSLYTVYEGVDTLGKNTDPDDEANKSQPKPQPTPPPPGEFAAATVVLLTDGENNQDPPPLSVVDQATKRGVRVYTVGVGTPEGALVKNEGRAIISRLDEDTLKQIAEVTHARYFSA